MTEFDKFLNTLKSESNSRYSDAIKDPQHTSGLLTPEFKKNETRANRCFRASLDYSLDLLDRYHYWLLENYDIKPKF